jgi:apolipoprotein N-acyltransferase
LNPVVCAGVIWPGLRWAGLALAIVAFTGFAFAARSGGRAVVALGLFVALSSAAAHRSYDKPQRPSGWSAKNTDYERVSLSFSDYFRRNQALIETARSALEQGARVVILPEQIAGPWSASSELWWREVGSFAEQQGAILLVGAEVLASDAGEVTDSLIVLGSGGRRILSARQPLPVAEWRPWERGGTRIGWRNWRGVAELDGRRAALSFCYEDLLVLPVLLSLLGDTPDVLISVANNWWARGLDEPYLQATSIEAWANLFEVPLLRAVNAPRGR